MELQGLTLAKEHVHVPARLKPTPENKPERKQAASRPDERARDQHNYDAGISPEFAVPLRFRQREDQ